VLQHLACAARPGLVSLGSFADRVWGFSKIGDNLARLQRQAAAISIAETAANAEAARQLETGDVDAATTAGGGGGRVLDLQATQRVIAVQIEQTGERRRAVLVGTGADDALTDLRRECQNAVATAASARREAERIVPVEADVRSTPAPRPVPDVLTIQQRRRIERDLERARRAGMPAVVLDDGQRLT
jgi:hypothetical protein